MTDEVKTTKAAEQQRGKDAELIARLGSVRKVMLREIKKVIVGQDEVLEQILITLHGDTGD